MHRLPLLVPSRYGAGVPVPGVAHPADVLGDASGDAPGVAGAYDPSSASGVAVPAPSGDAAGDAMGLAHPLCGAPMSSVLAWSWATAMPAPPPTIMTNTTERMIRRIMTPPASGLRGHFQGHPDAANASIPLEHGRARIVPKWSGREDQDSLPARRPQLALDDAKRRPVDRVGHEHDDGTRAGIIGGRRVQVEPGQEPEIRRGPDRAPPNSRPALMVEAGRNRRPRL